MSSRQAIAAHHKGQSFGGETLDYGRFASLVQRGAQVRTTQLTDNFSFADWLAQRDGDIIPLFAIDRKNKLQVFSGDQSFTPEAGSHVIGLDFSGLEFSA